MIKNNDVTIINRQTAATLFADILTHHCNDIGEAARAVLPNAINDINVIHTFEDAEFRHRFGMKVSLLGPKKEQLPHVEHWHEVSATCFHQEKDMDPILVELLKGTLHELAKSDTMAKLALLYADEIEAMKREMDDKDRQLGKKFVPEIWSDEISKAFCNSLSLKNLVRPSPGAVISTWEDKDVANRDEHITKHAVEQVRITRPMR